MIKALYSQEFKNITQDAITPEVQNSYLQIKKDLKEGKIPQIQAIFDENSINEVKNIAEQIKSYKKILVLGVGGSSLGGKAFTAIGDEDKIDFLESIDPVTVDKKLQKIDLDNCFFIVISKSGNTVETISQTLILIDRIKKLKIENFAEKFLFITQDLDNPISNIAKTIGSQICMHPSDVGGRFSCFTIVGLLPAILAGVNIDKILQGAKSELDDFMGDVQNNVTQAVEIQNKLFDEGFTGNVVMPYIDDLKRYTDWYRQLWAESLGKNGFGSTPINSMGTIDQHSQLQLYLEGPRDKFFTFFVTKKHRSDTLVQDLKEVKTLFGGKRLSEIVKVESRTTIQVLEDKNLPIRLFKIDELNEEALGSLMMHMFLEVVLIAQVRNIDPFDQPGVEIRKKLAKELLNK